MKIICPRCDNEIEIQDKDLYIKLASKGGSSRSALKQKASRENGKKGGRPKK